MKVYMAVTADEYELPVVVVDSPAELAEIYGMTKDSVLSALTRGSRRKNIKEKFIRLEIDED